MTNRTTVNFSDDVAPIFKKYANTYGVKNTCSLGAILINQLAPHEREKLMGMVAEGKPTIEVDSYLVDLTFKDAEAIAEIQKINKKAARGKKQS